MKKIFFIFLLSLLLINFGFSTYLSCTSKPIVITDDNVNKTINLKASSINSGECITFDFNEDHTWDDITFDCHGNTIKITNSAKLFKANISLDEIIFEHCIFDINLDTSNNEFILLDKNSNINDFIFDDVSFNLYSDSFIFKLDSRSNRMSFDFSNNSNLNLVKGHFFAIYNTGSIYEIKDIFGFNVNDNFITVYNANNTTAIYFNGTNDVILNFNNQNVVKSNTSYNKLVLEFDEDVNVYNVNSLVYGEYPINNIYVKKYNYNLNNLYSLADTQSQQNLNITLEDSDVNVLGSLVDANVYGDLNLNLDDSELKLNDVLLNMKNDLDSVNVSGNNNSKIYTYNKIIREDNGKADSYLFKNLTIYKEDKEFAEIKGTNKTFNFENSKVYDFTDKNFLILKNEFSSLFLENLDIDKNNSCLVYGDSNFYSLKDDLNLLGNAKAICQTKEDLNVEFEGKISDNALISEKGKNIILKGNIENNNYLFMLNNNVNTTFNFENLNLTRDKPLFILNGNDINLTIENLNYNKEVFESYGKIKTLTLNDSSLNSDTDLFKMYGLDELEIKGNSTLNTNTLLDVNYLEKLKLTNLNITANTLFDFNIENLTLIDNNASLTYDLFLKADGNQLDLKLENFNLTKNVFELDANKIDLNLQNCNVDANVFLKSDNNAEITLEDLNLKANVLLKGKGKVLLKDSEINANLLFSGNFDVNVFNNILTLPDSFLDGNINGDFNVSKTSKKNIVDGNFIGGNKWTNFTCGMGDVDKDGICDESYDFNNLSDYLPLFDDENFVDIATLSINLSSNDLNLGDYVIVSVNVKNVGDLNSNDVNLKLFVEDNLIDYNVLQLNADENKTVDFNWHINVSGHDLNLFAYAYYNDNHLKNNNKQKEVNVRGVDLKVKDINMLTQNPEYDQNIDFNVCITNIGDFNYNGDFNLEFYANNTLLDLDQNNSLRKDENKCFVFRVNPKLGGNVNFKAKIVLPNIDNDGNKQNNELTETFYIKAVDLTVLDLTLNDSNTNIEVNKGDIIKVDVNYKNIGDLNSSGYKIKVYANDALICDKNFNSLDVNDLNHYDCNFSLSPNSTTDYAIKVIIDDNEYDLNSDNNFKTLNVRVKVTSSTSSGGGSSGGGSGSSSSSTSSGSSTGSSTKSNDKEPQKVDLEALSLDFNKEIDVNSNLMITFNYRNNYDKLNDVYKVKILVNDKIVCSYSYFTIKAKEEKDIVCYYKPLKAGTYTVKGVVDYNDDVLTNNIKIGYFKAKEEVKEQKLKEYTYIKMKMIDDRTVLIMDSEGNPLPNTQIEVTYADGKIKKLKTDSKGYIYLKEGESILGVKPTKKEIGLQKPTALFVLSPVASKLGLAVLILLLFGMIIYLALNKPKKNKKLKTLEEWDKEI